MDIKEYLQTLIGKEVGLIVNGEELTFVGKLLSVETDYILMKVKSRGVVSAVALNDISVVETKDE